MGQRLPRGRRRSGTAWGRARTVEAREVVPTLSGDYSFPCDLSGDQPRNRADSWLTREGKFRKSGVDAQSGKFVLLRGSEI